MQKNNRSIKQGDKLLKMPGKLDRGPVDFKSHIADQEGEVMAFATQSVVSVPPTMTILGAVDAMTRCGFRRLPVVDPGSRKLRGIITSGDIINFMGGGDKFNLVLGKHGGNLIAAVNDSVREIMTQQLTTIPHTASINDVIEIIVGKKIGGIPILRDNDEIAGIVTERDVMKLFAGDNSPLAVEDVMSTDLRVVEPDATIGTVTKEMTRHRFRRLPVVSGDVLFGIITTADIMRYLGSRKVFSQMETGQVSEVMDMPIRGLVPGNLFTVGPNRNVNEAAREMLIHNVGALPVIENTRLIGLVTEHDLVKAFARR